MRMAVFSFFIKEENVGKLSSLPESKECPDGTNGKGKCGIV